MFCQEIDLEIDKMINMLVTIQAEFKCTSWKIALVSKFWFKFFLRQSWHSQQIGRGQAE